jgi:hypothetical protein
MNQNPNNPRRSLGSRSAIVGLLLAALLALLWFQSHKQGQALFLFAHHGKAAALVSLDGQILIGATNIPFGPGRAWTAQTVTTTSEEMRQLREAALDTPSKKQAARFAIAANVNDAFGVKAAWCRLVAFPHWLALTLALLPVLRWTQRRLTRRRRRIRGRCLECGYDLRSAQDRCPECGASISQPTIRQVERFLTDLRPQLRP